MKHSKILTIILLLLLSILTFYRLLRPGFFSMMDDMHVFRLEQFDQCLKDGQIPCRFINNGGLGYGYPLFNYYSPLPYAIAESFHLIGFSFINSLKILFILCHIIGVFGMYLFASSFFGKAGGILSAIIFLFAPYQATDSFVRGAIAESLAINLIPWVFYFVTKFIRSKQYKILLTLSLTSLLLSHNLISLAIAPILLVFSLLLLSREKKLNLKSILNISIPVLLALMLSSFFIVPALLEKNLVTVNTMTQGYFNYINHFATLNQLFISRFWGYGASLWGPIDDMAFSVGIIQWILPLFAIIFIFFQKNKKNVPFLILFFLVFVFSLFLTHNKSTFIWKSLPFMAYFQFPWRFLSITIFASAFLSGFVVSFSKKNNLKTIIISLILILLIALNLSYFKEDIWYPNMDDNQKLSSANTIIQSGAGLNDYWPNFGKSSPINFAPEQPVVVQGEADFIKYFKKSNYSEGYFSVFTPEATINLPMVYFPNWELYLDDQKTDFNIDPELGLIQLKVNQGEHEAKLYFKNTPIRIVANSISLFGLFFLLISIVIQKKSLKKDTIS